MVHQMNKMQYIPIARQVLVGLFIVAMIYCNHGQHTKLKVTTDVTVE